MKQRMARWALLAMIAGFFAQSLAAGEGQGLRLAPPYSDHMVLQRDHAIVVSGTAEPSTLVSVRIDGLPPASAVASDAGDWQATLPAMGASTGLAMTITAGKKSIELKDVAVGDVFLCSGQSNMEFPLRLATGADNAIAASKYSDLRLLHVPRQSSAVPLTRFAKEATWQVSSPATTPEFSAACYFMGARLLRSRKVPIGLIASSWGGSFIEAWFGPETLRKDPAFSESLGLLELWQEDPAKAEQAWLAQMQAYLEGNIAAPNTAVEADPTMNWEHWGKGLQEFDGAGTYTITFALTPEQARSARRLTLGTIDDIDETIVNGRTIGMTAGWDVPREYDLPQGILKPGKNLVEVRVLDTGGGGGLYGPGPRSIVLEDGKAIDFNGPWEFRPGRTFAEAGPPPRKPWIPTSGLGTLSNGMITPLGQIPLAGIAWYQGESNASNPARYRQLLPQLMAEWRKRFDTRRFAVVQLANFGKHAAEPRDSNWARLRDVQRQVVASDPDAGLAITIDIGDPYDIHPGNKRDVGHRLAEAMEGSSNAALPIVERKDGLVTLTYPSGLRVVGNGRPVGFEVCDGDQCRFVDARLAGDQRIVFEIEPGDDLIRYLWADSPIVNLFDLEGRPATPFQIALQEG